MNTILHKWLLILHLHDGHVSLCRVVSDVEGVVCVMESERTKLEKFHKVS